MLDAARPAPHHAPDPPRPDLDAAAPDPADADAPVSDPSHVGAFFDVDNTLIPGQSIEIRFVRYLWKAGLLSRRVLFGSAWYMLANVLGGSAKFLTPKSGRAFLREYKGYLTDKRPAGIEPLARWFVRSEIVPCLSSTGTATLTQHRQAGHTVALVSGTPAFLIHPLAHFLNVPNVLAAQPAIDENGYTCKVLTPYPYGEGKRHLIRQFADAHGVDLAQSYAYGDSPGDMEVLQSVGHPLVVNPIRGMAKVARLRRWPIAVWT